MNHFGGGLLLYAREGLSSKTLTELKHDSIIENRFVEIWGCNLITELFDYGDLSVESSNIVMEQFC